MTYFLDPVQSTALVVYNPLRIPSTTDKASRKALEDQYLNTYKALHLGGKETLESRMIRSAFAFCPTHSEKETAQRLSNYSKVVKFLSHLTNEQLSILLTRAKPLGFRYGRGSFIDGSGRCSYFC